MSEEAPVPAAEAPAPKAKKSRVATIAKWVGIVVACLVLLVVLAFVGLTSISKGRANKIYPVNPVEVTVLNSPEDLAEGARLARARGCAECHGDNLAGRTALDEMPMAILIGANLTGGEGSRIDEFTDEDIARIITYGVYPDGHIAFFMPSHEYNSMPPTELGQIIGYIRSVPPVDNDPGKSQIGPIGRMLHARNLMPMFPAELIDHDAPRPSFDMGNPMEFGHYLSEGCRGCHGDGYSGGPIPGAPPSMPVPRNITLHETGISGWTQDQFAAAVRDGTRPDGTQLDPFMPYSVYSSFTDDEISALWTFLQTVEPQAFGNR